MLRALIVTLGGDSPGINATVRSVTRLALRRDFEVYGAKQGWSGLLQGQFWKLKETDVGQILDRGGSIVGSTDYKLRSDDLTSYERLAHALRKFDLVVAVGGLGSFAVLHRMYDQFEMGTTTTMFVPASIENEFLDPRDARAFEAEPGINGEAIGADSAVNTAVAAVDRLRQQSHHSRTVFFVQTVGLKSNYLPVQIGLSCGAHRIYLPRFPIVSAAAKKEIRGLFGEDFDPNHVDLRELVSWIETMFESGRKRSLIVVIPNGVPILSPVTAATEREIPYEETITSAPPLEFTVLRVAETLSIQFADTLGGVHVRHVILDDLQRGGAPTARDRVLGTMYGEAAVEEFLSLINGLDTRARGNLNLLTIAGVAKVRWRCHTRDEVGPLFRGDAPRAGGLDPLPYFRQSRGVVSGYRPLSTL